jgi:hypothetical protein
LEPGEDRGNVESKKAAVQPDDWDAAPTCAADKGHAGDTEHGGGFFRAEESVASERPA